MKTTEKISKKGSNSNFLKVISFIAVVLLAISCSSSAPNPVISTQYTDSEIETLIQSFNPNRNIQPTATQLQRFQRDFPNAREVDWESNNQIYEVEFEINHRDFTAFYDNEGNLLMFKQEILNRELPKIVKATVETHDLNFRLESNTYKIVKGTQTFFRIRMEQGKKDVIVFVSSKGNILNRKSEF